MIDNQTELPHVSEKEQLSAKELGVKASRTMESLKLDPETSTTLDTELKTAKEIIKAIRTGEISDDAAAEIIATRVTGLIKLTETDPLTEIPNRRAMERIIREQVALAKRNGTSVSVAFIDLDGLKEINDNNNHDFGDAVLQGLAGFLKSELRRPTDKAGRWAGDEFVIVLPDTNNEGAGYVLNDVRRKMNESVSEATLHVGGYKLNKEITASIGFASIPFDENSIETPGDISKGLIRLADKRMFLAKRNGRNRVVGPSEEKILENKKL